MTVEAYIKGYDAFDPNVQALVNTTQPVTKRYLCTNSLVTELPHEFRVSRNKKYIHVLKCTVFEENPAVDETVLKFSSPQFATMHADFVQDARHLDSFVCFANQELYQRKKFEQFTDAREIRLWFKEYDGTPMKMIDYDSEGDIISRIYFTLELLLEY